MLGVYNPGMYGGREACWVCITGYVREGEACWVCITRVMRGTTMRREAGSEAGPIPVSLLASTESPCFFASFPVSLLARYPAS